MQLLRAGREDVARTAETYFFAPAQVYAVFDNGVALGIYQNGRFTIRFGKEGFRQKETEEDYSCSEFPWKYLQEIRVFNKDKEVRLRRRAGAFVGKVIEDGCQKVLPKEHSEEDNSLKEIYYMDEDQKLWGSIKAKDGNWRLLESQRGSRLWVPFIENVEIDKWICIKVRKYMIFPDLTKYLQQEDIEQEKMESEEIEQEGLVRFLDERFLYFTGWPGKGGVKC